nr:MAG TPA: hypothetical protein [Caudoviricetes sp.]
MKNKLYRIRIDNYGYVKAIVFDIEPTLRVIPTMEIEEAGIYEEDKAKYYCNTLNYENQSKNIKFTMELVENINNDINNNNLIELIKNNPNLPLYAYVDYEIVGGDCGYWMGEFGKAKIKEYATVEPYGWNDMNIVYKDEQEDYIEYLLDNNDDMSEEDATRITNNLPYKKAIFVYVETPHSI